MQRPNPNQQFQLQQQQQQSQQKSMVMQQSSTSSSVQQQSSQQFMSQEFSQQQQFSSQQRISQHSVSRQVTQQRVQQQHGAIIQQQQTPAMITSAPQTPSAQLYQQQQAPSYLVQSPGIPADASPPVFEQIFKNSRFAQGGNALFEGKLKGNPRPEVSWTRKGAPLLESAKHKLSYNPSSGLVSLLINQIGPGDEGEYTCKARNAVGEAICSVFIQPEGMPAPQFQQVKREQQQQQQTQVIQQKQITTQQQQYSNGFTHIEEEFKVDTFEYRLLREVSFRESITRRYAGETDAQLITTLDRALGPPAAGWR